MDFKWHILIGFTASYILIQFFNFPLSTGIIIFISSWLIDIDHYLWYTFEAKDPNPFHAIKWYLKSIPRWHNLSFKEREKFKRGVFILHGISFWIILTILSFVQEIFLWILIGVTIHMVADLIDLTRRGEPLYNKILPYYVIRRNKNKKRLDKL